MRSHMLPLHYLFPYFSPVCFLFIMCNCSLCSLLSASATCTHSRDRGCLYQPYRPFQTTTWFQIMIPVSLFCDIYYSCRILPSAACFACRIMFPILIARRPDRTSRNLFQWHIQITAAGIFMIDTSGSSHIYHLFYLSLFASIVRKFCSCPCMNFHMVIDHHSRQWYQPSKKSR